MPAPAKVTGNYTVSLAAPAAFTQRWAYTVPVTRFTDLEAMTAFVMRDTAPGALGYIIGYIELTPAGGAPTRVIEATCLNAAVDTRENAVWAGSMKLQAGDVLAGFTLDNSTGGSHRQLLTFVGTEYDV